MAAFGDREQIVDAFQTLSYFSFNIPTPNNYSALGFWLQFTDFPLHMSTMGLLEREILLGLFFKVVFNSAHFVFFRLQEERPMLNTAQFQLYRSNQNLLLKFSCNEKVVTTLVVLPIHDSAICTKQNYYR